MLGFRFVKYPPTQYLLHYSRGKVLREGPGLAFWHFAPYSTLVSVPVGSSEAPFIFEEATADFQTVTVQGQVTYRVVQPKLVAQLLDFTVQPDGRSYRTDDPEKLPQRVLNSVQVLTKSTLQARKLQESLRAAEEITAFVKNGLTASPEIQALGLEVVSFAILAIKPTPETARALEAETREALLRQADEATYVRRNAAVEQERSIKENELKTEELVQVRQQDLREKEMQGKIRIEDQNKALVALAAENERLQADAKAYSVKALMQSLEGLDPRIVQTLAASGLAPDQLIGQAFGDLAARAEKIGELNISPDLLQNLLQRKNR
jgi:hypothetical protein